MQRTKAHVDVLHSVLGSTLALQVNHLREGVLSPAILSAAVGMPTPPDPADVDKVPALRPLASGPLMGQLNEVMKACDQIGLTEMMCAERLRKADELVAEAETRSELAGIDASSHGEVDWEARAVRQSALQRTLEEAQQRGFADAERRREHEKEVVKPVRDRVYKWKHDERNKLYVQAASGPGGAQFVMNHSMATHVSAMNVSICLVHIF